MATVQGSLLLVYALIAIIALVVLIARFKMNPFITLMMVSVALALAVGMPATSILKSFETGVGGEYFLSKTTDLYLNGIYQRASGSHAWVEGISNPSSNNGQFVTVAGIRHKF